MIRYGELLQVCRQSKHMTQEELAKKTYTTQSMISSYESGRIIPRITVFAELLEACGYEIGVREKKDAYTADEVIKIIERSRR